MTLRCGYLLFDDDGARAEFTKRGAAPPVPEAFPPSIRRGRIFAFFDDEEARFEFWQVSVKGTEPEPQPEIEVWGSGGWGAELWYYDVLQQIEEARRKEVEAARQAVEARKQEEEAQAALEAAEARKAYLAEARARLAEITEARRAAEADAELARFHVERMRKAEAQALAAAEEAEEEEAMALCLMMLLQ